MYFIQCKCIFDSRKHTQYSGGYHANHKVVLWLWDILKNHFSAIERGQFLKVNAFASSFLWLHGLPSYLFCFIGESFKKNTLQDIFICRIVAPDKMLLSSCEICQLFVSQRFCYNWYFVH